LGRERKKKGLQEKCTLEGYPPETRDKEKNNRAILERLLQGKKKKKNKAYTAKKAEECRVREVRVIANRKGGDQREGVGNK